MNAPGFKHLIRFEQGEKLSLKQSILAKCCECTGKYADGKRDCGISKCPLYPFMPYGKAWEHRLKKIRSPNASRNLPPRAKKGIPMEDHNQLTA